jgi:hypothetical protein
MPVAVPGFMADVVVQVLETGAAFGNGARDQTNIEAKFTRMTIIQFDREGYRHIDMNRIASMNL